MVVIEMAAKWGFTVCDKSFTVVEPMDQVTLNKISLYKNLGT